MAYTFMLGVLPLPIPPSSLDISTPSMNETITLINDGEINIPKTSGLREISFEFLLPTFQKYPFTNYRIGDYTAPTFIQYIKYWKDWCVPMPFIVVRMSPAGKFMYFTSIMCLIEDFTFNEDAEELGFDTKCQIKLKEYKPYGTKRIKIEEKNGKKTATLKNERSTADRIKKSEIKPKEGESLVSAAKREGYDPKEVMEANGINPTQLSKAEKILAELENLTPEQLAEELPDDVIPSDTISFDDVSFGKQVNGLLARREQLEKAADYFNSKGWNEPWEAVWSGFSKKKIFAVPLPVRDTSPPGMLDGLRNMFFGTDYTDAKLQQVLWESN